MKRTLQSIIDEGQDYLIDPDYAGTYKHTKTEVERNMAEAIPMYWVPNPNKKPKFPKPDDTEPIRYGNLRRYDPNPMWNPWMSKTIRGKGRYYRRRRRYYRRRYRRTGRRRFRGYGGYTASAGANYGAQIGGHIGANLGEYLGGAAQNILGAYTGLGDYNKIQGNALLENAPIQNPNPHGGQVFHGCEYLGDIVSSATLGGFQLQSFPLNPAMEQTFPKLAQFLANYDQYVFEGMYFEYRTMSGMAVASNNTSLGSVIMVTDYNVLSQPFVSKMAMENYEGGISVPPSNNCKYFIECARSASPMDILYTRTGAIPANADLKLYDLGNFQIATQGFQATSVNCGELWVCYQVAGLKSKLYSGLGNYNNIMCYSNTVATGANPLGTGTNTTLTGSNPAIVFGMIPNIYSAPGWYINANIFYFPISPLPQTYEFQVTWAGSSAAVTQPVLTFTNCTQVGGIAGLQGTVNGDTTQSMYRRFEVTALPNVINSISFGGLGTLPGSAVVTVIVTQIANFPFGV